MPIIHPVSNYSMDTRFGVLPPPVMPGSLWGGQAPRDIAPSCRVNPTSTMKFTPQSYEHPPKKSSCAECGGAPTSTQSSSPCGRPFNQQTIEGEACLTSSPCPPRSALCCTGACSENLKVSDVSGGTTVEGLADIARAHASYSDCRLRLRERPYLNCFTSARGSAG